MGGFVGGIKIGIKIGIMGRLYDRVSLTTEGVPSVII